MAIESDKISIDKCVCQKRFVPATKTSDEVPRHKALLVFSDYPHYMIKFRYLSGRI